MSTEESKSKGQQFSELTKRNELPHHLGMIGYAAKRKKWWQEESEAAASGQENPLLGINKKGRDYFNARRPKRLKQGRTKYNEPKTEAAEKALITVNAAKECREFKPNREHALLMEALGNPECRGRVRGVSLRMSWKNMDSCKSDAASHHPRQRYKEGLIQQGRDEAMKEIIRGTIQEMFTSTDPKIMELRM